jgi:hypothetical protein
MHNFFDELLFIFHYVSSWFTFFQQGLFLKSMLLKFQTALTGRLGQSFNPAMIQMTITVKHNFIDPRRQTGLGNSRPHQLGGGDIALMPGQGTNGFAYAAGAGQGRASDIVYHLRVDVIQASAHRKPGTIFIAFNFAPHPRPAFAPSYFTGICFRHHKPHIFWAAQQ